MFLSERNSIVLTFETNEGILLNVQSILSRLSIIMRKNILPVSILILGVGKADNNLIEKLRNLLNEELKSIRTEIQKDLDVYLK